MVARWSVVVVTNAVGYGGNIQFDFVQVVVVPLITAVIT